MQYAPKPLLRDLILMKNIRDITSVIKRRDDEAANIFVNILNDVFWPVSAIFRWRIEKELSSGGPAVLLRYPGAVL